jgi:nucleotide-binding universal stress UspA family protein
VIDLIHPAFIAGPYGGADYMRILAILDEGAERYLAEVAARERRHGLTVETAKVTGVPATAIARYGTSHPGSLLVLGTHGRSGWRAAILGSVARRVLLLADGPVLLVRAQPPA